MKFLIAVDALISAFIALISFFTMLPLLVLTTYYYFFYYCPEKSIVSGVLLAIMLYVNKSMMEARNK